MPTSRAMRQESERKSELSGDEGLAMKMRQVAHVGTLLAVAG